MKQFRIIYFKQDNSVFCSDVLIKANSAIEALIIFYKDVFEDGFTFFELRDESVVNSHFIAFKR